jgi:uncharacterized protein
MIHQPQREGNKVPFKEPNARPTKEEPRTIPSLGPRLLARAGEPKKLVVLKGFGHYEVYGGDAFRQVMEETLAWCGTHLPAR